MKCTNCGKEFGEGVNCQFCGIDRVSGLGNYNGYQVPSMKHPVKSAMSENKQKGSNQGRKRTIPFTSKTEINTQEGTAIRQDSPQRYSLDKDSFTVCYACNEAIPSNSRFCPMCGVELFVACPKCGFVYSSQFPFCSQCGTNRTEYLDKQNIRKERRSIVKKNKEKEKEEMLERIREVDSKQRESNLKKEQKKESERLEEQKRKEERSDYLDRLAKDIETKQRLRLNTPEGKAEYLKGRELIEKSKQKWHDIK